MSGKKVIKSNQIVKIISPEEQTYISTTDAEMDFRAVQAVRAAVPKAKNM